MIDRRQDTLHFIDEDANITRAAYSITKLNMRIFSI